LRLFEGDERNESIDPVSVPPPILCQLYWHAPQLWPVAAGGAAVLLIATLWLYPAQLGRVPWPWRGVLPALRVLAVVALGASVLKPVAVRLATADERGQIVVLVDCSRSMSVVDNARSPAQLVALADALGKLPPNARPNGASGLAAGLEQLRTLAADAGAAREDLDYARVSGRDIDLRQTRLREAVDRYWQSAAALAAAAVNLPQAADLNARLKALVQPADPAARQAWRTQVPARIARAATAVVQYQESADAKVYQMDPAVRKACDALAGLSRFALVEQALLRPGGLLPRLEQEAAVTGLALAGDVQPLPLWNNAGPEAKLNASPDGDASNLTSGIARAVAGRPVRAVVLFSDGRQVGGDPTVVSGLTPNGVPVFAVSAAAAAAPHDLSFASISSPASVFVGQSIIVKAELRHNGFDGAQVQLHCGIAGQAPQVRKVEIHNGRRAGAEFFAKLIQPGAQRIDLWFDPLPGEASTLNNRVRRWVKVAPQRLRVLLVAGYPTWDFQYVRNSLARINPLTRLAEVELKDRVLDPNHPRLRLAAQEILRQDVIILFDVPVTALDERQWDALERVPQVMGGSIVLVAGEAHLPREYNQLIAASTLLPFRAPFRPAWRVWPGEDPAFHFVPAPRAEQSDVLQLSSEPEGAPRRWEQLPGAFRFLQLPDVHDERWKQGVTPLLVEEESRLPVLTEMRLGAGRAFFLGIDETWRWRFKIGGRDQDRFWWQLIEYASEDPYFAHAGPLALDADTLSAAPGEAIHVRARMTEESPAGSLAGGAYLLDVLQGAKTVMRQALSASGPPGSGRYAATLSLPAGEYRVRWKAAGADRKSWTVEIPLHVEATSEAEMADLSGDDRMLRKLAEASGGEFLTLDQVNRLPGRLAAIGDARSHYAELALWDSPYLFLLVVGCLGAEWALRKRLGLA